MKHFKAAMARAAVTLVLALGLAWPAGAQSAKEGDFTDVLAKARPYQDLTLDAQTVFIDALNHINEAFLKAQTPLSKAEAKAWSDPWATKARSTLTTLQQRLAETPRISAEEVRTALGGRDPRGYGKMLSDNPKIVADILAMADKTVSQTAVLAPLVAAGDEAAVEKLSKETIAVTVAMTEIENAAIRRSITTIEAGHPQRSLAQAALATNLATMELLKMTIRTYDGEAIEGDATAKRMRVHLAEGERAARRIRIETEAAMTALSAAEATDILAPKIRKALASYPQSAEVELEILGYLNQAATAVSREHLDGVDAALTKVETVYDQRIALQRQRASILTE